jgi:hypothetical protein
MARIKCFLLVGVVAAGLCLGTGADAMSGAQKYNGTHVSDARGGNGAHARVASRIERLLRLANDDRSSIKCPGASTAINTDTAQTCIWRSTFAEPITCVQVSTSPRVTQLCEATQTNTTSNNSAQITQTIVAHNSFTPCEPAGPAGRCQGGTQMVKLRQTNAAGGNAADIAQYVKQALGPGTPDEGNEEELEPNAPSTRSTSTQKQESHQVVHLQQISTSGNNSAPIVQSLRQRERAGNAAGINQLQNTDDAGLCVKQESDGLPASVTVDADANMCILLNQSSTNGRQSATLTGDYREFQRARSTGTGQQVQGNLTPFLGGEDYGLLQASAGVSNVRTTQDERQVQRAVETGSLTQSQNGPRKGEGSLQSGNGGDAWQGSQTSTQLQTNRATPAQVGSNQSIAGTQKNLLLYSADTPGNVSATQRASQNGTTATNSCSGTSCEILLSGSNGVISPTCPTGSVFNPFTQTCDSSTTVDCAADPNALATALASPSLQDGTTLAITGTCTGSFEIAHSLTLAGSGAAALDGQAGGTVLTVDSGRTVDISRLTIKGGHGTGNSAIGGIYNQGTLRLEDSSVSGNSADSSSATSTAGAYGGILNLGTLTLIHSSLSGNSAQTHTGPGFAFGGILNGGTLTLAQSTVTGNTATATGTSGSRVARAGIENGGGAAMTITDSSVNGNSASAPSSASGGILNAATLTLTRSSVSGNSASSDGGAVGGIGNGAGGSLPPAKLTVRDSTVSGNSAGSTGGSAVGGIGNGNATISLTNSVVVNNIPINCNFSDPACAP